MNDVKHFVELRLLFTTRMARMFAYGILAVKPEGLLTLVYSGW